MKTKVMSDTVEHVDVAYPGGAVTVGGNGVAEADGAGETGDGGEAGMTDEAGGAGAACEGGTVAAGAAGGVSGAGMVEAGGAGEAGMTDEAGGGGEAGMTGGAGVVEAGMTGGTGEAGMTDGAGGAGGGDGTVRCAAEKLVLLPVDSLVPYEKNAKLHGDKQIKQLRASLREFGFVTPLLVDSANRVIAGHGRLLAAKAEHMTMVPCVLVSHLTEAQRRAYILADNRLAEGASWDMALVDLELSGLAALDFDCKLTGFTPALPETPVEKPHGTLRAPKTCTCPSCGCEFTPGKKK